MHASRGGEEEMRHRHSCGGKEGMWYSQGSVLHIPTCFEILSSPKMCFVLLMTAYGRTEKKNLAARRQNLQHIPKAATISSSKLTHTRREKQRCTPWNLCHLTGPGALTSLLIRGDTDHLHPSHPAHEVQALQKPWFGPFSPLCSYLGDHASSLGFDITVMGTTHRLTATFAW